MFAIQIVLGGSFTMCFKCMVELQMQYLDSNPNEFWLTLVDIDSILYILRVHCVDYLKEILKILRWS